jgi:nucleoid-associated protein YejK
MTGRNGRSSWERQGIVAFCTCQWNRTEYLVAALLQYTDWHNVG